MVLRGIGGYVAEMVETGWECNGYRCCVGREECDGGLSCIGGYVAEMVQGGAGWVERTMMGVGTSLAKGVRRMCVGGRC